MAIRECDSEVALILLHITSTLTGNAEILIVFVINTEIVDMDIQIPKKGNQMQDFFNCQLTTEESKKLSNRLTIVLHA